MHLFKIEKIPQNVIETNLVGKINLGKINWEKYHTAVYSNKNPVFVLVICIDNKIKWEYIINGLLGNYGFQAINYYECLWEHILPSLSNQLIMYKIKSSFLP